MLRAPHDDGGGAHEPGAPMALEAGGWEKSLGERIAADEAFTGHNHIQAILNSLESDGYLEDRPDGYIMTAEGLAALTGPNGNEPPPMTPAMISAMRADGSLTDDEIAAWSAATGMEIDA